MSARRLPDRFTVLVAICVIAGTAGLLWGADALSRVGAQSLVARAVQRETAVADRPVVRVHGAAFLPQVLAGRYDDVTIDIDALTAGPLRIAHVHAEARGVHLPFHDVLVRDVRRVVVDHSTEDARLRLDDLNRYLDTTGRPLSLAPGGGPHDLRLTGTVSVLGRKVSASADARVAAGDGTLDVTPVQLDTGQSVLDAASRLLLRQQFTFQVPLDALPFGQRVTGIEVGRQAITVRAEGTGVSVTA